VAEFTVRAPYTGDLAHISFFKKAEPAPAGVAKGTAARDFPKGKLLGSFAIPKQESVK
jgi:hypothetical protein